MAIQLPIGLIQAGLLAPLDLTLIEQNLKSIYVLSPNRQGWVGREPGGLSPIPDVLQPSAPGQPLTILVMNVSQTFSLPDGIIAVTTLPAVWKLPVKANSATYPNRDDFYLNTTNLAFKSAKFVDANEVETTGSYSFLVDGNGPLDLAGFAAATAAIPESEIQSKKHRISVIRSITSNVAGSLILQY